MSWSMAARIARRELRGGLRAFRVFLACLALGVGGLAAVGSIVSAINDGLSEKSQALLGGDVRVTLTYRFAEEDERAAFAAVGDVSEVVDLRGMARRPADESRGLEADAAVVQIKAVDDLYPLYGAVTLDPPIPLTEALGRDADGRFGLVAEPALVTRLGLSPGDPVRIGAETFSLRAEILSEPDRAPSGIQFGPRAMIAVAAIGPADLAQPGTLFEPEYRVRLDADQSVADVRETLPAQFPDSGWRWRDYTGGAPGVERVVERIGAFLTLVGLAALAVGGVGVGASVRSYLDGKTETIATLKTLGADGTLLMRAYLLQIGALAGLGVGLGLIIGAAAPILLAPILADRLPVPANFGVYLEPLAEAGVYGLLAAFLFALWPLARAREVRAAGLFRDLVSPASAWPRVSDLTVILALGLALTAAAVVFTGEARLALGFVGGVLGALILLTLSALALAWIAGRLARTWLGRRALALRLALSSVAGAGAGSTGETRGALLALGLGLTVLTGIGLIDVNLRNIVSDQLPSRAPAYFVIDIQNRDIAAFKETARAQEGVERVETAPMLRGVISAINGVSVAQWRADGNVADDYRWVLRGDRGVTYADTPPDGTELVDGVWWPEGYSGRPQVSFGAEHGRGIGLSLGDTITVNVLGRDIEADVTSFRRVEFSDGGINFLMVFNQGVLAGAPHAHIATVYGEEPTPGAYLRRFAEDFPAATSIRTTDILAQAETVLGDVANAARAGAVATLITGLVVLIGAAAAGQRRQIYQAAILKTLGATRPALIGAIAWRSGLLGLSASLVAFGAGALGAWAVMTFVMEARFVLDWVVALSILAGGIGATMITGALFALGPLSARPARVLRARE